MITCLLLTAFFFSFFFSFCRREQGGDGRSSLRCLVLWSPVFLRCYLPAVLFTDGNKEGEVDPRYILSFCDHLCFVFVTCLCFVCRCEQGGEVRPSLHRLVPWSPVLLLACLSVSVCLSVGLSVHLCLCLCRCLSDSRSPLIPLRYSVSLCDHLFFLFFHLLACVLFAGANKEGQLDFCDHLCILLFCL